MKKLLTVAVPCYNAAWCLDKCLSAFLAEPVLDRLEVIVVNDGSEDGTIEVASNYTRRYPHVFRLVDKENGGHGSCINVAAQQAVGKYFKAVDADDWVLTENIPAFLDVLEHTGADAVLTHFHTVDLSGGEVREYKTSDIPLGKVYSLEEFVQYPGEIYPCASYHGLTYRTVLYRDSGTVLSEGVFYEDQEYATLPFTKVRTVLPLDMFLYEYMIGNENQSMSSQNQVKHLGHVEHVLRRLFRCYSDYCSETGCSSVQCKPADKPASKPADMLANELTSKPASKPASKPSDRPANTGAVRYLARKAVDMLIGYYVTAMAKNPDKRGGRREAARVRRELRTLVPELVAAADNKYRAAVIMNRLGFAGNALGFMKRPLPYTIYRKLFKRNSK